MHTWCSCRWGLHLPSTHHEGRGQPKASSNSGSSQETVSLGVTIGSYITECPGGGGTGCLAQTRSKLHRHCAVADRQKATALDYCVPVPQAGQEPTNQAAHLSWGLQVVTSRDDCTAQTPAEVVSMAEFDSALHVRVDSSSPGCTTGSKRTDMVPWVQVQVKCKVPVCCSMPGTYCRIQAFVGQSDPLS